MPFIEVRNWPKRPPTPADAMGIKSANFIAWWQTELGCALRRASAMADLPGVTEDSTTVTFGGPCVVPKDKVLGVIVTGLFDRPDRTKEMRDRLADYLADTALQYLSLDWRVEVLVHPFDTEHGPYVSKAVDNNS